MEIFALLSGLAIAAYALRSPLIPERKENGRRSGRPRRWAPRQF